MNALLNVLPISLIIYVFKNNLMFLGNRHLCVSQKPFVIVIIQQFMTFNIVIKCSNK